MIGIDTEHSGWRNTNPAENLSWELCIIINVSSTQKICLVFPRDSISYSNALEMDGNSLEQESWGDVAWRDKIKEKMIKRLQDNDGLLFNRFNPYAEKPIYYVGNIQWKEGKEMVELVVIIGSQGINYI